MDFLRPIPELALQKIKLLPAQHFHLVSPHWSATFLSSVFSVLRQQKHKHLAMANIASGLQSTDFGKAKKKTNKGHRTLTLWQSYWPVMFTKLWDCWQIFTFFIALIWLWLFLYSFLLCQQIYHRLWKAWQINYAPSRFNEPRWNFRILLNSVPGDHWQLVEIGQRKWIWVVGTNF